MSKLSEQREKDGATPPKQGPRWIWILLAIVVLVGVWAAYDYYSSRNVSTLDNFAKCVSSQGTRMYGAWWCPHCADQKESFGLAFQYVTYTECGIEGQPHSLNDQCRNAGIKNFPTWQFADGHREEGVLSLPDLASKTRCKLP
ncbi:MAG TPA: hypothetical protein VJS37_19970 [Terriglobales bacterium]|nr:hypothetical protein [Terriglobales bacterium]